MKIKTLMMTMIVLVLLVCSIPLFAQAPTLPGDPEGAPIDGGLSLLVAAGVGYGAKKLKERKAKAASADKG